MDQDLKNLIQNLISTIQAREAADQKREQDKARSVTPLGSDSRLSANIQRDVDSTSELVKLENQRQGIVQAINREKSAALNVANQEKDMVKQMLATNQAELSAARQTLSVHRDELSILKQALAEREKSNNLTNDERNQISAKINAAEAELGKARELVEAKMQALEATQKMAPVLNNLTARTSDLVTVMTRGIYAAGASERSFFGALFGTGSGATFRQKLKAMGKGLDLSNAAINTAVGGASSLMKTFVDLAMRQDQAAASFGRATGASREYNSRIIETVRTNHNLAVTLDEGYKAFGILYNQMNSFSTLTATTQKRIADFALTQERLGVSFETTAKTLNIMTKTFGNSGEQAMAVQRRINAFAREIGVSEQVALDNFVNFSGALASHGPRMEQVFKGLQEQAKRSGVAMGDLMQVARQFDTFEGAASVVGKLNALLGGNYLNTVRLVAAEEQDRIRMINEGIAASNRSIASLGRWEKVAIANAIGAKDAATAMRMLREQMGMLTQQEIKDAQIKAEETKRANELLEINRRLKTVFIAVANALLPMIENLAKHKDEIVKVVQNIADFITDHGRAISQLMIFTPIVSGAAQVLQLLATGFRTATFASKGLRLALMGGVGGGLIYLISEFSNIFTKANSDTFPQALNKASSGMSSVANSARNMTGTMREAAKVSAPVANNIMRISQAANSISTSKVVAAASAFGELRKSITSTVQEAKQMRETTVNLERATRSGVTLSQKPQVASVVSEFANSVGDFKRVREASERQQMQSAVSHGLANSGLEKTLAEMWPRNVVLDAYFDKTKVHSSLVSLTREARKGRGSIYG